MTSPTLDPRLARIEKLAGEAECFTNMAYTPRQVAAWFRRNNAELATLLRDLKTRIEAEDGGGL